jgi:hypothetical protein
MCVVQEGQISDDMQVALRSGIGEFTKNAFNAEANIDWIVVGKTSGFTAGKPSTSVIASMHANRALVTEERVKLLTELNDLCADITGRTPHEIVTSIRDPQ